MAQNLTGPHWGPASGGKPRQLVVICHGLGANGDDLIQLAPTLGAALPEALFVAPDAPALCDMGPDSGRQWFSLRDRRPTAISEGVRAGAAALDGFLDATLAQHGLAEYALAGFSQGAMISLFGGLRRAAGPHAILAYSGALIDAPSLVVEMKNKAPVLLVHGLKDATVPPHASRAAEAALRAAGVAVESHFTPELGHSIDQAGLTAGVAFLRKAFPSGAFHPDVAAR